MPGLPKLKNIKQLYLTSQDPDSGPFRGLGTGMAVCFSDPGQPSRTWKAVAKATWWAKEPHRNDTRLLILDCGTLDCVCVPLEEMHARNPHLFRISDFNAVTSVGVQGMRDDAPGYDPSAKPDIVAQEVAFALKMLMPALDGVKSLELRDIHIKDMM